MQRWVRFADENGEIFFGTIDGSTITKYEGELFADPVATSAQHAAHDVALLQPCAPTKIVALWNNFHASAEKQNLAKPESPLYFIKPSSCLIGPFDSIRRPPNYDGRIMYEGELGIVIGTPCKSVAEAEAERVIFGYTCINDVTAFPIIRQAEGFEQWTRAKSFDTFGAIGPCIATGLDPESLRVRTLVDGRVRQDYPVSDMIIGIARLVSAISHDMTLYPGDIIACGTSSGVLPMKPNTKVEVMIEGIGTLENVFEPA